MKFITIGEYDLINADCLQRINVCGGDLSILMQNDLGNTYSRVISYASEALAIAALDDIIKQLK